MLAKTQTAASPAGEAKWRLHAEMLATTHPNFLSAGHDRDSLSEGVSTCDQHAPAQAVEEGDAMKVDKRRKKKAAEEADARADAVFAEEVRDMQSGALPT